MKVLVVDDQPVTARLFSIVIRQGGHEAVEVTDKFEELLISANPLWEGVDILLCDLRLPGISGIDIVDKARLYFPHIYRVIVTVSNPLDIPSADLVLYKPQDVESIVSVINTVGGRRAADESR